MLIECKRPQKITTIESNLDDAVSDQYRRFNEEQPPNKPFFGVAALSIGKAYLGANAFTEARDEKALANLFEQTTDKFVARFRSQWNEQIDTRFIGLIFEIAVPAVVVEKNIIVTSHYWTIVSRGTNLVGQKILQEIAIKYKNQINRKN